MLWGSYIFNVSFAKTMKIAFIKVIVEIFQISSSAEL